MDATIAVAVAAVGRSLPLLDRVIEFALQHAIRAPRSTRSAASPPRNCGRSNFVLWVNPFLPSLSAMKSPDIKGPNDSHFFLSLPSVRPSFLPSFFPSFVTFLKAEKIRVRRGRTDRVALGRDREADRKRQKRRGRTRRGKLALNQFYD